MARLMQLEHLLSLSFVRELGPVVTAILFAGRAGSSLTTEVGLMKNDRAVAMYRNDGSKSVLLCSPSSYVC